jgi:hypothetical protein
MMGDPSRERKKCGDSGYPVSGNEKDRRDGKPGGLKSFYS